MDSKVCGFTRSRKQRVCVMHIHQIKQRVMFWSGIMILPTSGFLIYYLYESMTRFISRSLTHPEFWENHWMIDKGVSLDLTTRKTYFVGWMPVIGLSCLSFVVGLYLLNRLRQGLFFEHQKCKSNTATWWNISCNCYS